MCFWSRSCSLCNRYWRGCASCSIKKHQIKRRSEARFLEKEPTDLRLLALLWHEFGTLVTRINGDYWNDLYCCSRWSVFLKWEQRQMLKSQQTSLFVFSLLCLRVCDMQFQYEKDEIKSWVERFCYGKNIYIYDNWLFIEELNFMCTYWIFWLEEFLSIWPQIVLI